MAKKVIAIKHPLKLVVTRRYRDNLKKIVLYGETVFGTGVAEDFLNEAHSLVARLQQMPHIHPKSRFIDSTPDKTYRNIYFRSHTYDSLCRYTDADTCIGYIAPAYQP